LIRDAVGSLQDLQLYKWSASLVWVQAAYGEMLSQNLSTFQVLYPNGGIKQSIRTLVNIGGSLIFHASPK
jgi:hypothetical protein